MRDQLHSEIDQLEELRIRAKQAAEDTVVRMLEDAVDATGDIGNAMRVLADEVGAELADLTTESFLTGVEFARQRKAGAP